MPLDPLRQHMPHRRLDRRQHAQLRRFVGGVAHLGLEQLLELDELEHPGTAGHGIDGLAGHDVGQHLAAAHVHRPKVHRDLVYAILTGNVDAQVACAFAATAHVGVIGDDPAFEHHVRRLQRWQFRLDVHRGVGFLLRGADDLAFGQQVLQPFALEHHEPAAGLQGVHQHARRALGDAGGERAGRGRLVLPGLVAEAIDHRHQAALGSWHVDQVVVSRGPWGQGRGL
ncbi:hypothetical protein D3C76_1187980 [compost metagenome]